CLKCGEMFGETNRENIRNACRDCGKFKLTSEMVENGNVSCNECGIKYESYLQEKAKENEQKNQQIANLEEQNKTLNQQLAEERKAKETVQAEKDNIQNELDQLQQELEAVQQELTELQAELKSKGEKTPDTNTDQAIEKLDKTQQKL